LKNIKTLLDTVLVKRNIYHKIKGTLPIIKWKEIVGEPVIQYAKPVYYKDGILFIEVENALFKRELSLMASEILEKIQKTIPDSPIKELKFILRSKNIPKNTAEEKGGKIIISQESELTADDLNWIDSILQRLKWDKKLKKKYRDLLIEYKKTVRKKEAMGFKKCAKCGAYFTGKGKLCPVCEIQEKKR